MENKKQTTFEEFKTELLQDPEFLREYEALKPKYDMIRSLIKQRNKLGISQKELAEKTGTKQPAISRLEKGDYNTTLNTFFKVAAALDLEICVRDRQPDAAD